MITLHSKKSFVLLSILFTSILSCNYEKNPCYDLVCESNQICVEGSCIDLKDHNGQFNFVNTPKPDRIILSEFFISRFPEKREDGSPWDPGSKPDVFIQVVHDATIIFETPSSIKNLDTVPYQITLPNPLVIDLIEESVAVHFYHDNEDGGDPLENFVGGTTFIPFQSDFPDTLAADLGGLVAAKFTASYEFD